jgi:thiol-disulfide isomerase/thioredoxin
MHLARASAVLLALALAACKSADTPSGSPSPEDKLGSAAQAEGGSGFVVTQLDPGAGDIRAALEAEAAKAKRQGLKPYAELWATWCKPCMALKGSLKDPRMQAAFKGTYIVQLEVDAWGAKLDGAGLASSVIPVLYALDDKGKPTGRKIDGGAWDDNIPENMAPPLDKFFHGS